MHDPFQHKLVALSCRLISHGVPPWFTAASFLFQMHKPPLRRCCKQSDDAQLLADSCERLDRSIEVLGLVRARQLHADASRALWHHGEADARRARRQAALCGLVDDCKHSASADSA